MNARLTRKEFLRAGMISFGALLAGCSEFAWPEQTRTPDAFVGGKQTGLIDFIHEGPMQMDTVMGAELDGRLYTDLSTLTSPSVITPTKKYYVRTLASTLLPAPEPWQVGVDGLVNNNKQLDFVVMPSAAKPMGLHLMECAGNTRMARFGMLSVADWAGVPVSEIVDNIRAKREASHLLIAGFDQYAAESTSSIPGASWIFSREELKAAGAFLATAMNGQPLTRDHGSPVRLVIPGWYGCACIKWVNRLTLVDKNEVSTSQMQEYASRTLQNGVPGFARGYQPAVIDQAAMPIRVEKWLVHGKLKYRVVGIAWGGSRPVNILQIRFNPEEDYLRVRSFHQNKNDPWTLWTHTWLPKTPGTYSIRLAVKDPVVPARRLNSGHYVRTVDITEV